MMFHEVLMALLVVGTVLSGMMVAYYIGRGDGLRDAQRILNEFFNRKEDE